MKRVLSFVVLLALVLSLGAAAVGCKSSGEGSKSDNKYADEVPGGYTAVSKEVMEALTQTGTVTSYVFSDSDKDEDATAGRPLSLAGFKNKAFNDKFEKLYGGKLDLTYTTWEGWENKFITDFAADDAPDLIYGYAKLWPKIANRGMVYSNKELKDMGVLGLDHPVLQDGMEAVEANFTYKNEVYGLALHRSGCFWGIVNEDLYDQYGVKSPTDYYNEGLWDYATFEKSSIELITAAGGAGNVYGYYCWDYTTFVRANGQQLIGYDPATGTLTNNMEKPEVVEALENLRLAYNETKFAGREGDMFNQGKVGIMAVTDENIAGSVEDLSFKWSLVPYPKGRSNTNNQIPGSVSAWMVTTSADNPQGAVNLVIAYLAAVEDGTIPLGESCIEYALKDRPEELQMVLDNKIHGVNDNLYGVGSLWSNQWNFWTAILSGKQTVNEVIGIYKSMFDAQVEEEMLSATN